MRRRPGGLLVAVPCLGLPDDIKEEAANCQFKKMIGPSEDLACGMGSFTLVDLGPGHLKALDLAGNWEEAEIRFDDGFFGDMEEMNFEMEDMIEVCQNWLADGNWGVECSRRLEAYVTADEGQEEPGQTAALKGKGKSKDKPPVEPPFAVDPVASKLDDILSRMDGFGDRLAHLEKGSSGAATTGSGHPPGEALKRRER